MLHRLEQRLRLRDAALFQHPGGLHARVRHLGRNLRERHRHRLAAEVREIGAALLDRKTRGHRHGGAAGGPLRLPVPAAIGRRHGEHAAGIALAPEHRRLVLAQTGDAGMAQIHEPWRRQMHVHGRRADHAGHIARTAGLERAQSACDIDAAASGRGRLVVRSAQGQDAAVLRHQRHQLAVRQRQRLGVVDHIALLEADAARLHHDELGSQCRRSRPHDQRCKSQRRKSACCPHGLLRHVSCSRHSRRAARHPQVW